MALGGHFLSSKDYVDAICDGLTIESDSFVVSISSRIGSYTKEEIEPLLMAQESIHGHEVGNISQLVGVLCKEHVPELIIVTPIFIIFNFLNQTNFNCVI